jgi:thymidylate synthase
MLLKRVGDEIGAASLAYTHISASYHIYESDYTQASRRFNAYPIFDK